MSDYQQHKLSNKLLLCYRFHLSITNEYILFLKVIYMYYRVDIRYVNIFLAYNKKLRILPKPVHQKEQMLVISFCRLYVVVYRLLYRYHALDMWSQQFWRGNNAVQRVSANRFVLVVHLHQLHPKWTMIYSSPTTMRIY